MKRFIVILFFVTMCLPILKATHLIGGSMSYQYLGQNSRGKFNYKVTLSLYRDCQQSEVQFDPEIKIGIYHSNTNKTKFNTASIKLISKSYVQPPGSTNCPFKPSVCIEEAFYEGIIEVEPSTLGYEFTFERCCRNIQNNIETGSGGGTPEQGQTYYCKIPPTNIKNSSPIFKGVPSPYMCANDTTSFLNTALDADGDSLVYYFVKPFGGSSKSPTSWEPPSTLTLKPIIYNAGYNENIPFGSTGYSNIDRFNGLTQYYTTVTGNYVVAIEVAEYRNGVLLGTVRLDLQIIFINCPPNKKPNISSDKGKSFVIEAGSKLCFNVISTDPDNDNLILTPSGEIFTGANGWKGPKATLSAKTGKGTITSEFCWQTSCAQANSKPYQFAVKVDDDGCPGKFNAVNFTIKVNPFISIATISGNNSLCQNAIENYTASNLAVKSSMEWAVTNGTIISGQSTNSVKVKWTGTTSGKVQFREFSEYGCVGNWKELIITINPSPPIPIISGPDTVCLNSNGIIYGLTNFTTGLSTNWTLMNGNIVANNNNTISTMWPVIGNQILKVITINANGCKSDTAYKKINVRKPNPSIFGPNSVCPNAKNIEYSVFGLKGSSFQWTVNGGVISGGNTNSKVSVNWGNAGLGDINVIEKDRFGCTSNPIKYDVNKTYILDSEAPKGKISVCEFAQKEPYFLFPANGTSFNWSIKGGNLNAPGNLNLITVDWLKAGIGEVEVVRQAYDSVNKKACISAPEKILVTIHATPNANTIKGAFEICQTKDTMSYTLNGFAGSSYLWAINGNSLGIVGQGTKTIKVVWNTAGSFLLEVQETSKDSCKGNSIDTTILIHPKPISNLIAGPSIVCDPDFTNKQYIVSGYINSTYWWSVTNGTIISGNGTGTINVDWIYNAQANLKTIETSEFGCLGDTLYKDIVLDKLDIEMLVISVGLPDDQMEINWKNSDSKAVLRNYEIQKRKNGDITWGNIKTINSFLNYIEQPINTDLNAFDYRINSKDLCSVDKSTEVHTNVWLWGSKTEDPYAIKMQFTPYQGFKNGVNKYVLYRKNSDAGIGYQVYDSFLQPKDLFYNNGLEGYYQCYRILAYENGGNQQKSWSNEICFHFAPTIYIPNAFTPNGDGLNDNFSISAGAIKTFDIKIYNRWGERLWESNDFKSKGWDGFYKEKAVQTDVYMYVVTLTDFRDKVYRLNGTVQVIR